MSNWIKTFKIINWPIIEKDLTFTDHLNKKNHKKFKKGDKIIFFISDTDNFGGVFEATSDWYESEYVWPDKSSTDLRINLKHSNHYLIYFVDTFFFPFFSLLYSLFLFKKSRSKVSRNLQALKPFK